MMKLSSHGLGLIVTLAFLCASCQQQGDSPADTRADVAEQKAEGAREVGDAHRDAALDPSLGTDPEETAAVNYRIQKEQAEAKHEVARERCGAWTGGEKDACLATALAEYEANVAAADSNRRKIASGG